MIRNLKLCTVKHIILFLFLFLEGTRKLREFGFGVDEIERAIMATTETGWKELLADFSRGI